MELETDPEGYWPVWQTVLVELSAGTTPVFGEYS